MKNWKQLIGKADTYALLSILKDYDTDTFYNVIYVILNECPEKILSKKYTADQKLEALNKIILHFTEKEEYENTVSNELYLNMQEDEIEFSNELFRLTYYELVHQLNQKEKIVIDQLIMHENTEISGLVTNILMDEEKYTLSSWERKEVFVTETEKILPKLVTDAILNLRRVLIEKKIEGILTEMQNSEVKPDLEEIGNYTELKKLLFEKLNRVI